MVHPLVRNMLLSSLKYYMSEIFFLITYNTESIMYILSSVLMMKTGIRLALQLLPVSAVEVFRSSFVLHSNHAVDKSF